MQPLTAEIVMDWGYFMLASLNCSLIHFLKLKYHILTYIAEIVPSNANLNPLKVFSVTNHTKLQKYKTFTLRKYKNPKKRDCGRF
jgi:hypothetical protein